MADVIEISPSPKSDDEVAEPPSKMDKGDFDELCRLADKHECSLLFNPRQKAYNKHKKLDSPSPELDQTPLLPSVKQEKKKRQASAYSKFQKEASAQLKADGKKTNLAGEKTTPMANN